MTGTRCVSTRALLWYNEFLSSGKEKENWHEKQLKTCVSSLPFLKWLQHEKECKNKFALFSCSWNRNWLCEWLLEELVIDLRGLRKFLCAAAVSFFDKITIKNTNCLIKSKIFSFKLVLLPPARREAVNA